MRLSVVLYESLHMYLLCALCIICIDSNCRILLRHDGRCIEKNTNHLVCI